MDGLGRGHRHPWRRVRPRELPAWSRGAVRAARGGRAVPVVLPAVSAAAACSAVYDALVEPASWGRPARRRGEAPPSPPLPCPTTVKPPLMAAAERQLATARSPARPPARMTADANADAAATVAASTLEPEAAIAVTALAPRMASASTGAPATGSARTLSSGAAAPADAAAAATFTPWPPTLLP